LILKQKLEKKTKSILKNYLKYAKNIKKIVKNVFKEGEIIILVQY